MNKTLEGMARASVAVNDAVGVSLLRGDWPSERADTILSALRSAGWAVVPVEPTEVMLENREMDRIVLDHARALHSSEIDFARIWRAMITAAQEDSRE